MTNNIPSRNPSDDDSLQGLLRIALRKHAMRTDDMLPCHVISYDRNTNRVMIRHFITMIATGGETVPRSNVASIPALVLGAGDFFVNFNIQPNDFGWIKASDRDISLFLQSYSVQPPNDKRVHDFSSGLFIPDVMTNYTIAEEDSEAMVIQNRDGSVKLSLDNNRINMNAPTININGQNAVNINAPNFTVNSTTTTINGNTGINGSSLTHNGTNVGDTHSHPQGVDSRGDTQLDTGGPQ